MNILFGEFQFYLLYLPMAIILLLLVLNLLLFYLGYKDTEYASQTGTSWRKVYFDKGLYGEYLSFLKLQKVPGLKRFLFNAYIPTTKGGTSEVDLILIHPTGVFVIESKNYSGWIFGQDTDKTWTQSLENKKKCKFGNPVWQNEGHIKHLKGDLNAHAHLPFYNVVVFSERCELKKVSVTRENTWVIQRQHLTKTINKIIEQNSVALTTADIADVYRLLRPHMHVTDAQKRAHIDAIKARHR